MPARVVLVTGVNRLVGARLVARLAAERTISHVIAVDTAPDLDAGRVGQFGPKIEHIAADIRSPQIAGVIAETDADTVIHTNITAVPAGSPRRAATKELNVIGTMQLLAACQRAPAVRKLVLRSSTAIYGASPTNPALLRESDDALTNPRGYGKDAADVEGYAKSLARQRTDIEITVLRLANLLGGLGSEIDTLLSRYFRLPAVPTVLGFDARLQFLHLEDCLEALTRAALQSKPGTFNVAGPGVLLLSQAIRRAGKVQLPLPKAALSALGSAARLDFSDEQLQFLSFGRAVDLTRLSTVFGFVPRFTTAAAFAEFIREQEEPIDEREAVNE